MTMQELQAQLITLTPDEKSNLIQFLSHSLETPWSENTNFERLADKVHEAVSQLDVDPDLPPIVPDAFLSLGVERCYDEELRPSYVLWYQVWRFSTREAAPTK
jgi:hypothetical protein